MILLSDTSTVSSVGYSTQNPVKYAGYYYVIGASVTVVVSEEKGLSCLEFT